MMHIQTQVFSMHSERNAESLNTR